MGKINIFCYKSVISVIIIKNRLLQLWISYFGGLNEIAPYILVYLNGWPPVSRTVWERLGGGAFIGGGVSLGLDFEVSKTQAISDYISLPHGYCHRI